MSRDELAAALPGLDLTSADGRAGLRTVIAELRRQDRFPGDQEAKAAANAPAE